MAFKLKGASIKSRYGNTALVTGASSGIGKAFATALANEGMDLVLVARREQNLLELGQALEQAHGINCHAIPLDLTARDAAEKLQASVADKGLQVDLLVNNAGVGTYGPFQHLDIEREGAMIDLNCRLPVLLTRLFLPAMLERRRGGIIMLASVAGAMPVPFMSSYSATKAFDRFFAESLYGELRGSGVDVLAVLPGDTQSEFKQTSNLDKEFPIPPRTPENVVNTALKALGRRPSVTDGFFNWISVMMAGVTPRRLLIRVGRLLFGPA